MIDKAELRLFSTSGAPLDSLKGRWRNELGSVMTVEDDDGDGGFRGRYESQVSGNNKPVSGTMWGTRAGDCFGFVVNWRPTFDSVTSWSGKILVAPDGAPYLYTLWDLSRGVGEARDWWQSFLAGSDRFRRD